MLLASDDQILQRLLVLHNVDQRAIVNVASFMLDYWHDAGCRGSVDLTLLGYTGGLWSKSALSVGQLLNFVALVDHSFHLLGHTAINDSSHIKVSSRRTPDERLVYAVVLWAVQVRRTHLSLWLDALLLLLGVNMVILEKRISALRLRWVWTTLAHAVSSLSVVRRCHFHQLLS